MPMVAASGLIMILHRCAFLIATGLLFATAAVTPARATEPAQDEALAYTVGVQTYIYSYPLMDLYRTLWETSFDPKRGHDRTINEFYDFRRLVTSADDWVVTPNEDTIYSRAFLDLRKEPIILMIPPTGGRQFWFPVSDMHHDFDANLSWDTIGSRGGAFAFCPPGWQGVLPDDVKRIDVGTPIIWTLGRFGVNGDADVPNATALQDKTRLVPLSQWGQREVARPRPNASDYPIFTRADFTDARKYFTTLNSVLRLSPRIGSPIDTAMRGWMQETNLDPSQGFDWNALSPAARSGLERAAVDANRIITERQQRAVPIVNNWQIARLNKRGSDQPVIAAASAMLGLLYNPREVSTYDVAFRDGKGAMLDGRQRYVLRLDPPPPVNAFWSLTMYSGKTMMFVSNRMNRYSIGDRTGGLVYGPGGSLELYLQRDEPTDPKERANWLPAPDGPFYLVMRHYSPRAAILTGDWVPPPVTAR